MRILRLVSFAFLVLFMFSVLPAAFAQGATEAPAPVIIPDDAPVAVPMEWFSNTEAIRSLSTILLGIIAAIAGGGSFALVITRLDKRSKDEAERLYLSWPPETQNVIHRLLDGAEQMTKLMREITDGRPNVDPAASTLTPGFMAQVSANPPIPQRQIPSRWPDSPPPTTGEAVTPENS